MFRLALANPASDSVWNLKWGFHVRGLIPLGEGWAGKRKKGGAPPTRTFGF